jgi:hypothetical protein
VSGPSDKAIQVAGAAERLTGIAADGLRAAHDPALGLDRSVCLRDATSAEMRERVADALHRHYYNEPLPDQYADETADDLRRTVAEVMESIEREFGGGS